MRSFGNTNSKMGLFVLVLLCLILGSERFFKGPIELISSNLKVSSFSPKPNYSQSLTKIVSKDLEGKNGDYAIYIEDLTDHEKFGLNENEIMPAASLYKLYLMAAVLEEVDRGQLTVDSQIYASKSHLEDVFGDTDFGYEDSPEEISYTVLEALQRVGRISDNFAAIMLAEKIGWDKVQTEANLLGASSTIIKNPISTDAVDTAKFFNLLFFKKVGSENISNQIIDLLSLSKINDRIPADLPDEVRVVHKTGELDGLRHDAGIVFLEGNPYLIVLMSQNLQYEDSDGVDTLAQISKDVYTYFSKKGGLGG